MSLPQREKKIYQVQKVIKEYLSEGKRVDELNNELIELKKGIHQPQEDDGENNEDLKKHIDNEYAKAGLEDPKILLTTCRSPTTRLVNFAKELKNIFPNCTRINRGDSNLKEIKEAAHSHEFTDVIFLHEHQGNPDGLVVSHLPFGPTAYFTLRDVVLRHDVKTVAVPNMSLAFPHLIFEQFASSLGVRLKYILKYLFPVPKSDTKRIMTFANRDDTISFRHHTYEKNGKTIKLVEVGPRFEMKPYRIRLGTFDQTSAEDEWVLRPFMNTSRKRKFL